MISIEFVENRTGKTRDMQVTLSTGVPAWVWSEKTVALWVSDGVLLTQLIAAESAKRTLWRNAAEIWQSALDRIQATTRTAARKGSYHFRLDPPKQKLFDDLHTDGKGRGDIYAQGLAARDAWEAADPAWTLSPEPEDTLGALSSLLASSLVYQTTHGKKETEWRLAANTLMMKAQTLDQECIAWYADATRKFAEDTAEGATIRQTVPTTTRPDKPVGQAVISHLMASGSDIHFDCAAAHATKFTYLQLLPGAEAFVVVAADTTEASLTLHHQPAGLHKFKAIGRNSRGEGPESAIVEITVAAQAAA